MAYVEVGEGDPIVFLHGVPTSSYLWRNVMPHLEGRGRLIAPDLIGMGDSEKLSRTGPGSYSIREHASYLFPLLEQLRVVKNVVFVLHDWGSGLGFHWAEQHRDAVKGLAFMEAIPTTFPSWEHFPRALHEPIQALRSPRGETMALEENFFIETLLPAAVLRELSEAEMAAYRRPFLLPGEARRPTLAGPRSLPIAGEPKETHDIVASYAEWLADAPVPKLFINAEPGAFLVGYARDVVRRWTQLEEVTVRGAHFIQEDSPDAIGRALARWLPAS